MNNSQKISRSISILLPTKNDEEIIYQNINNLLDYLDSKFNKFEIIIISNGSDEINIKFIEKIKKLDNRIKVFELKDSGKGIAIKKGIEEAENNLVLIYDSDFAYNINDIEKFFNNNFEPLAPFVVATRDPSNHDLKVSSLRKYLGLSYNFLFNLLFNLNLPDTQAGFKLIDKEIFEESNNITMRKFSYDVELILLAINKNIKIEFIPVEVQNNFGSTSVNYITTPLRMFLELIYLKIKYR